MFRRGRGQPKPGAVWHDTVLDLGSLAREQAAQRGVVRRRRGGFPPTLLELIRGGEPALRLVHEAWEYGRGLVDHQAIEELARRKLAYPLKRVRLLAPIGAPRRNVFCLGRNYADHAAERGAAVPEHPVYFTKPDTAVVGPGDDVIHHAVTNELDYEVELAVVIGVGGRDIARADALAHVFGYTVINDVSAREVQRRHGQQWFKGKSLDGHCPMGPWIVTADKVKDWWDLRVVTRVNGVVKQDSNTRHMYFKIPRIIAELSAGLTLEPGDIISTGTPAGVGHARTPPEFLKAGDILETEIAGIGLLRNRIG
jgi:2-keto-4-pentenoate hydratase/2-oxohepta-3-ene-1,7-dioic acid hydratase in catechol pathway